MKFDKELLLKHRFWVGIAIAYPLAIVGIALLLTTVSGQINAERKKISDGLNTVKKMPAEVWNSTGIKVTADFTEKAKGKQDIVWKDAYEAQAFLYRWPDKLEAKYEFFDGYHMNDIQVLKDAKDPKDWPADGENLIHGVLDSIGQEGLVLVDRHGKKIPFHVSMRTRVDGDPVGYRTLGKNAGKVLAVGFQRGRFFGDKMTEYELLAYMAAYRDQILPIIEQVNPLGYDDKGNVTGVVQLRGWEYDPKGENLEGKPFIRFMEGAWTRGLDFSEEAWMAQEDLWLQREIYRLIKVTNDNVSKLDPVDLGQKAAPKTARFQNPYFVLDLKLAGDELQVTITNRLKRRQKLDQDFLVLFQKGAKPEKIHVGEQPLDPAGTVVNGTRLDTKVVKIPLDKGPTRTDIYGVDQVLTWETAAVRRIDQLAFAQPEAHSHRTFEPLKALTSDAAGGAASGTPPVPGMPIGMPPGPGPGRKGGGPLGKGPRGTSVAAPRGSLPNGFWAERYFQVTQQARRIPVAVSLIVDQDHVDRVLTAFNNSPLRFLTTQVLISHYPGSVRPQPQPGAVPGIGVGPLGPSFAAPGSDSAAQDMEANLELVIYGIITMYERFPPRPPGAALTPPPETK